MKFDNVRAMWYFSHDFLSGKDLSTESDVNIDIQEIPVPETVGLCEKSL